MKKIFTLVAMALSMSFSANAQTENLSFAQNTWAWSQETTLVNASLTGSKWGGVFISNEAINADDYTSIKLTYSDLVRVGTEGWQLALTSTKTGDETADTNAWPAFMETDVTEGTAIVAIPEAFAGRTINSILVQAQTDGVKIKLISAALVKADGTEVAIDDSKWTGTGVSNGSTTYPMAPCTINITSQWNGPQICDSNGQTITRSTKAGDKWKYTLEFNAVPDSKFAVVINGKTADEVKGTWGYADKKTYNIAEGDTKLEFTIDDELTEDWEILSMKLSYMGTCSSTAPAKFTMTKMTREKVNGTGISSIKADDKANGVYYNLSGQRVAKPSKGIYIHNGKKIVFN